MKATVAFATTAVATFALALPAQAADVIKTYEGGNQSGAITSMSPTVVAIDTNPVIEQVSVGNIESIAYDGEPQALTNARSKVAGSQYDSALEQLKGIDVGTIGKKPIEQDVKFYYAKAYAKLALGGAEGFDFRTGGGYLAAFMKESPGNYHLFEANMLMGDLLVAAGNNQAAFSYYDKVEANANWNEAKMEVWLAKARAFQRAGDWAKALPLFQKVANFPGTGVRADRLKLAARLGEAAALAGTGKLDEGLKIVKDVIVTAEKGDNVLHARAFNTLGAAYQAAQKPKDALLAYLHTDVLYFQDAEFHAEALANLSQLWGQVNQPQRKQDAERRLKLNYPGSRWAKQ